MCQADVIRCRWWRIGAPRPDTEQGGLSGSRPSFCSSQIASSLRPPAITWYVPEPFEVTTRFCIQSVGEDRRFQLIESLLLSCPSHVERRPLQLLHLDLAALRWSDSSFRRWSFRYPPRLMLLLPPKTAFAGREGAFVCLSRRGEDKKRPLPDGGPAKPENTDRVSDSAQMRRSPRAEGAGAGADGRSDGLRPREHAAEHPEARGPARQSAGGPGRSSSRQGCAGRRSRSEGPERSGARSSPARRETPMSR